MRRLRDARQRSTTSIKDLHIQCRETLRHLVDQQLSAVPPHYREILVMCDIEGFPRKEVGQRLSLPAGTVSSRLARAREMFRRLLTRHGIDFSAKLPSLLATLHASTTSDAPAEKLESTSRDVKKLIPDAVMSKAMVRLHACQTLFRPHPKTSAEMSSRM